MIVIRNAKIDDIKAIYMNLNYNYVKKYYKNNEKKQGKMHEKWYKKVINSSNYEIFIIEDDSKNFLGCIKFKINKNMETAEISLYLVQKFRGKKYAPTFINISIEELKFKHSNLKIIIAYILEENEKSKNCFLKANFVNNGKIINEGIEYCLYTKQIDIGG